MKTIAFNAARDELLLRLSQARGKPTKTIGRFKLWCTKEGEICALLIRPFGDEQKEFRASLEQVKLGGMWKGVKFTDEEIGEIRREMWRKLERDA
jgi:hypothetical protein